MNSVSASLHRNDGDEKAVCEPQNLVWGTRNGDLSAHPCVPGAANGVPAGAERMKSPEIVRDALLCIRALTLRGVVPLG